MELAQRSKEKLYEIAQKNAFAAHIGMELLEVNTGYAKGRIRMSKEHTNIYEGMHGGCAYALADTLAGIAAATYGSYVTTVSGTMNYLMPINHTEYVYCEAKVVRQGGRVGVYDTTLTNDAGELLSTATFTYYKMKEQIK